jgi:predicted dienelactone hydrolase
MRRARITRSATAALALLGTACALVAAPRPLPPGSESAAWLAPGPYRVLHRALALHDRARDRKLASTVWWPAERRTPAPLVVQAHGFLANRTGGTYLARHLASRGYVVVAATHPTTTLLARGGARVEDVVRQPGDVRFLIDHLLAADPGTRDLPPIDPARIAVTGHSLGGLTATLAAFHPRLRDARIAAAVSIAGPMAMFEPRFFAGAAVPFLMIGGSGDVVVDYRRNALGTLTRVPDATVVLIAGASHAGFDHRAAGVRRLVRNPDVFSCWILRRTVHLDVAIARVRAATTGDEGIDFEHGIRAPCLEPPPPNAMDPQQQHALTTLAVAAFLESRFAPDPDARERARRYLTVTLPREVAEVSVATTPPSGPGFAAEPRSSIAGAGWLGGRQGIAPRARLSACPARGRPSWPPSRSASTPTASAARSSTTT